MDRRTALVRVLGGALTAGAALSGCDLLTPEPPPPHPLLAMLHDTRVQLARYEAAITAHPGLAERLRPLRDNHTAHVTTLAKLVGPQASASPSAAASASAPATPPADEKAALAALLTAERDGQAYAVKACLAARDEYAGLLGAIAACRASHAEVLK
ncbi:MAG: ferritin-like domain-containing protein [Micromonosporaceae bacterium]